MLSKWVTPRIGRRQLVTLTPAQLNKCYAELLESGGRGARFFLLALSATPTR
jgi:hypothetical protein